MQQVTTFLMFTGHAEEAMNLYTSLFPNSEIRLVARYGENDGGPAGTVQHAQFTLNGQLFMCMDSPIQHGFSFTPSTSLFATCDTASEVDALFAKLSEGGEVLMPLDSYPFSERYAWINDKYGVSWQLILSTQ